jgi:hypothetical protein
MANISEQDELKARVNFLQVGPGGICFAHGPYDGANCPKFQDWQKGTPPSFYCPCIHDPQKPEYIAMANEQARHARVFTQSDMDNQRAELHRQVREAVDTLNPWEGTWIAKSRALSAIDRVFEDGNQKLGEG